MYFFFTIVDVRSWTEKLKKMKHFFKLKPSWDPLCLQKKTSVRKFHRHKLAVNAEVCCWCYCEGSQFKKGKAQSEFWKIRKHLNFPAFRNKFREYANKQAKSGLQKELLKTLHLFHLHSIMRQYNQTCLNDQKVVPQFLNLFVALNILLLA